MSITATPSIFDTFNARNLSPEQVARTFVPSDHFDTLTNQEHALVVGPRGSGKTTLFKMLHPLALINWDHPKAEKYRSQINFTGVFIPTDLNWQKQIDCLGLGQLNRDAQKLIERAAFTTHILHSLVESMLHRARCASDAAWPGLACALTAEDEAYIANEAIRAWRLKDTLPSFAGLRHSLTRRLSEIEIMASMEATRNQAGREVRLAGAEFLHLDFLSATVVAVELFNDRCQLPDARWALLFDELELAPNWIRQKLVGYLRSVDQRLLFKLSLSPFCEDVHAPTDSGQQAGAKQDFTEIRLWHVHKETGYSFCGDLLDRLMADKGIADTTSIQLLGRSVFDTAPKEWKSFGTAYRKGSPLAKRFVSLAEKDPTFRDYLLRKKIDCGALESVKSDRRASDVRKATTVVALRDFFRPASVADGSAHRQRRRSIEVPTIYAGATSLFAMLEGNPRWFIGVIGRLLKSVPPSGHKVTDAAQVREILKNANTFRAMLKTIPCPPAGGSRRGLLSILDPIGNYFAAAAIDGPFDPEPPNSFTVDSRTSSGILSALGSALNAGAIVYVPSEDEPGVLGTLRGKRFRLSYLLAPHYQSPLLLGRKISLNTILKRAPSCEREEPTLFRLSEKSDE